MIHTRHTVLPFLLSLVLFTGCAENGQMEPITRTTDKEGSFKAVGAFGKLALTDCGSDSETSKVINLLNITEQLNSNGLGQMSARLTTSSLRLLSLESQPLEGGFTEASDDDNLNFLVREGLIYDSGSASWITQALPTLSVVKQDGCKTVNFKTGPNEDDIETYKIILNRSNERQIILKNSKDEVRIYRMPSPGSLLVSVYEKIQTSYCGSNKSFYLEQILRLDMGEETNSKIYVKQNLLSFISKHLPLPSDLKTRLEQASTEPNDRTNEGFLISDANYIDIMSRIGEDRSLILEGKPAQHTGLKACK